MRVLSALFLAYIIYIGGPILLDMLGYVEFDNTFRVVWVLLLIMLSLTAKIVLTAFSSKIDEFTYLSHGFQLSVITLGGFLSTTGLQVLYSEPILGSLNETHYFYSLVSFLDTDRDRWLLLLHAGFVVSLIATLITALISHIVTNEKTRFPIALGVVNYLLGGIAFSGYVILLLYKGMAI